MSNNLIGIADIAKLIGLTSGSVKQMKTHGKLPEPDGAIGRTKGWKESTILKWNETRPKRYDNRKSNR
jgi:predicted DNA-binding transcriptional regulator AlpA